MYGAPERGEGGRDEGGGGTEGCGACEEMKLREKRGQGGGACVVRGEVLSCYLGLSN